jgi:uroporphyrin-III C-methyltransferase
VLVLYMALRRFDRIAPRLLAGGRAADAPVAFISDATTARQRVHITTLADGAAMAASIDGDAPTLIVIGPVVALRGLIAAAQLTAPMTLAPAEQRATA